MADLFLDPVSFFRSSRFRWGLAVLVLVGVQLVGVASLFVKMALFVPSEDKSIPVLGYIVGLGVSAFFSSVVSLGVGFLVFWTLSWFSKDHIPLSKLLATFCYALIPGHLGTLAVRSSLILLSTGSTSVSRITNATSLAAFVDHPAPILSSLDPFLLWSVVLLTIGHAELTAGRRTRWFSLGLSLVPVLLTRLV